MDEELAAGLNLESGGQWLIVWMETSDECCPLGSVLGPIPVNNFNSDIDSEVESGLRMFADDTKLRGCDAIQRDLDRFKQ